MSVVVATPPSSSSSSRPPSSRPTASFSSRIQELRLRRSAAASVLARTSARRSGAVRGSSSSSNDDDRRPTTAAESTPEDGGASSSSPPSVVVGPPPPPRKRRPTPPPPMTTSEDEGTEEEGSSSVPSSPPRPTRTTTTAVVVEPDDLSPHRGGGDGAPPPTRSDVRWTPVDVLVEVVSASNLTASSDPDWRPEEEDAAVPPSSPEDEGTAVGVGGTTTTTMTTARLSPYASATFRGREIGRTKALDPSSSSDATRVWTIETGGLFLIRTTVGELSRGASSADGNDEPEVDDDDDDVRSCFDDDDGLVVTIAGRRPSTLPSVSSPYAVQLGKASVPASDLLEMCDEERFEFDLRDRYGDKTGGTVALRFRVATSDDVEFVETLRGSRHFRSLRRAPTTAKGGGGGRGGLERRRSDASLLLDCDGAAEAGDEDRPPRPPSVVATTTTAEQEEAKEDLLRRKANAAPIVTETDQTEIAGNQFLKTISDTFGRRTVTDQKTGEKRVRVKPSPDPTRIKDTTYLSREEMRREMRSPTPPSSWTEAGSGSLGKIHLEILRCKDLPNTDVGSAVGNVTDSFVTVVHEDAIVQTPVIDDELSPMWMPWTKRGFVFNVMHPASMLYLAVFDYDLGPLGHEPIGRVAVNVGNFRRGMVYTLRYGLYNSSDVTERKSNGVITIRLRIEIPDEKAALLAGLKPRPRMHVNVRKQSTFHVARYTCFGQYDNEEKFDLTVFRSYINEIFEYKSSVSYAISDSLKSLMFWRGQVRIGKSPPLPLHSALFFYTAALAVERPRLIVPFLFFGVAWIMLASMECRLSHPSPWISCPSFVDYAHVLRTGKSRKGGPRKIDPRQNHEAAVEYEDAWKKRLEGDYEMAMKRWEMQQKINEMGDETIQTKVKGGPMEIALLSMLGRYQGIIGRICKKFRFVKIILTWEESVISFWITAFFLAAGTVSLFLPWCFIIRWVSRIIVWVFFGPWMKLVDAVLTSKGEGKEKALRDLVEEFHKESCAARIRKEEAVKLKSIKQLKFGEYITKVPEFNLARHHDVPLPESTARTFAAPPRSGVTARARGNRVGAASNPLSSVPSSLAAMSSSNRDWGLIPGQQLYGTMIQRPEDKASRNHELSMKEKERLSELARLLSAMTRGSDAAASSLREEYASSAGELHEALREGDTPRRNEDEGEEQSAAEGFEVVPFVGETYDDEKDEDEDDGGGVGGWNANRKLHSLAYAYLGMRLSPVTRGSIGRDDVSVKATAVAIHQASIYMLVPSSSEGEDCEVSSLAVSSSSDTLSTPVGNAIDLDDFADNDVIELCREEEGVEVVACDEILGKADDSMGEDGNVYAEMAMAAKEVASPQQSNVSDAVGSSPHLSNLYRSSEYVFVAFDRR